MMQLDLVTRYMSYATPSSPPPVLMVFKYLPCTVSIALSLDTANFLTTSRKFKSNVLAQNKNTLLLDMDGVQGGVLHRDGEFAAMNLGHYVHHAKKSV